ncbi:MAG: glycerol-3-phosphate 1-O-acyltransferase PlsY [Pseudomonadota bacterium]
MTILDITLVIIGYLAGSINSAIIIARLVGLPDPRSQGSGNPGATNMLRVGGKKYAALTLVGDIIKGVIPVALAHAMQASPLALALTVFAAFLGHLYPVFFRFKGGKGVATAFGVLVAAAWPVGLAVVATWLAMAALVRISSLSALVAALLAPVYAYWWGPSRELVWVAAIMTVIIIWRHRSNIRNLLAGTEDKISPSQPDA